jgi:uncharacterized phage infection (PIP) family protein YhgE
MKDEQLRILSEQNASLLSALDKVEDEANTIQMEKLAIEQENRSIRDSNFELQSRARAAETQSKRMMAEVADKEKQLRIMTDQNSELLRLLESEESLTSKLQGEVSELRAELDEIRQKHGALLTTARTHEELATKAAREGQLRAEEIRLLRAETEQLKQQNSELKMKTQVEVEALQEQLRVRKEKQYQLLEKLQVLNANIGMANVCSVPLSYIFMRGQGVKIFSLVSKKCRDLDHLIPKLIVKNKPLEDDKFKKIKKNNSDSDSDEEKVGYEGATVFPPVTGVHYEPIPVLDYASLYPRSMIYINISHECYVNKPEYDNLPDYTYETVTYNNNDGTTTTCRFAKKSDGTKGVLCLILIVLIIHI